MKPNLFISLLLLWVFTFNLALADPPWKDTDSGWQDVEAAQASTPMPVATGMPKIEYATTFFLNEFELKPIMVLIASMILGGIAVASIVAFTVSKD